MRGGIPRRWTVVVIVEDDTDGRALRKLAEVSNLEFSVDWLPANGIGNIKRKGRNLIALAIDRIKDGHGCVAVLVDRDQKDASSDEPHKTISRVCREAGVPYIEAIEAFEAWFLADTGICSWLGLGTPGLTDGITNPKSMLSNAFYRKTRRPYGKRRARVKLANQATGVDASKSESWTQALAHLSRCPIGDTGS